MKEKEYKRFRKRDERKAQSLPSKKIYGNRKKRVAIDKKDPYPGHQSKLLLLLFLRKKESFCWPSSSMTRPPREEGRGCQKLPPFLPSSSSGGNTRRFVIRTGTDSTTKRTTIPSDDDNAHKKARLTIAKLFEHGQPAER